MSVSTEIITYIKQILTDVFGDAHPSLALEESRTRKGVCYYYETPKQEAVTGMLTYLRETYPVQEDFPLNGLTHTLYDSRTKNTQRKVYVQLSEREDHVSLCFYPMEGIRFHRSYGKRIVASIYTGKDSLLELLVDDDWMIWTRSKAGDKKLKFNWWLNKCLRDNETIRTILVGLLRQVGRQTPIFRDVARTIENDHFFFPPLDFDAIAQCHTPAELMDKADVPKLDVNFNKLDVNIGYYLSCLAGQFDEENGIQLRDYPKDRLLSFIQPKDLYEGPNAERFLTMHYCFDEQPFEPWRLRQEVVDYLQMCIDQDVKPQILPSYDAFVRRHDEMTGGYKKNRMESEIKKPLVVEHSQFETVDTVFRGYGMENYEWITTGERLYEEGERQHNCVFTYRASIRKDLCAIFHLDRNGESYTIRIDKDRKGGFFIAEMRGRFNRPYREEDLAYVNEYLYRANRTEPEDAAFIRDRDQLINLFGDIVEINEQGDEPMEPYEPWEHAPDEIITPIDPWTNE